MLVQHLVELIADGYLEAIRREAIGACSTRWILAEQRDDAAALDGVAQSPTALISRCAWWTPERWSQPLERHPACGSDHDLLPCAVTRSGGGSQMRPGPPAGARRRGSSEP